MRIPAVAFGVLLTINSAPFLLGQPASANLSGRVTNSDGETVPAKVVAYEMYIAKGNEVLLPRCTATTQSDGKYECSGLPVGRYLVAAFPNGKGTSPNGPFFSPGSTTLSDAEPVSLQAGQTGWADVRARTGSGVSVSGKLEPSAPEAAFSLLADGDGITVDTQKAIQYHPKTGGFRVDGVQPGHYVLRANWLVDDAEHMASVPLDVGNTAMENIRVLALPNVVITGTVSAESAQNLQGVILRRLDGLIPDLTSDIRDGQFLFPVVPAGQYSLGLQGSNAYVSSVTLESKASNGDTFNTGIQPLVDLRVGIEYPGLSLNGTVEEWPSSSKKAAVIAVSEDTGTLYHVVTDSQRRFRIDGLAPGSYQLFAWPGPDLVAYRNASVRKKYEREAVSVSVGDWATSSGITLKPLEVR